MNTVFHAHLRKKVSSNRSSKCLSVGCSVKKGFDFTL